ncbi:tail length tape measure protein [Synechococcus virus S-ESS1]|uniref:Tail length tape measure protein n=1 Tax=Synechococcus virus S-ESS1 TaxID=1964565 RepID=A0A1V0DX13_9CAUD|nr:tail length tape measure protein [Synechococcus virus S-ESS1]ARB05706.1 tail length tape measure protein [Synechococcus virus S-ESS1]
MFAAAPRYHTGGIIGLKPGEVPIIAKQGEEMLTRDDPRHMLNGGGKSGGAAAQKAMTIINTFDPAEAVERALATPRGEEVLVNAVRSARTEVKAALG